MNKILVSYFSATGVTKKVAQKLSSLLGADLFEIEASQKYTKEDLDWTSPKSRSSIEMQDENSRPAIIKKVDHLEMYDAVIIGFPVWWYKAPTIINTFLEENDFQNKNIYIFVTSGESLEKGSFENLKKQYPNFIFQGAKRFVGNEDDSEYKLWIQE